MIVRAACLFLGFLAVASVPGRRGVPVAITVTTSSLVRGPGQSIEIAFTLRGGIEVETLSFRLEHDPACLSITGVDETGSGPRCRSRESSPEGTLVDVNFRKPVGAGRARILTIRGLVPDSAPYRSSRTIAIHDVMVNGRAASARHPAWTARQLVCYPGDATTNGGYSAGDAQAILELVTRRGAGSAASSRTGLDPIASAMVADVDGDGVVTVRDARVVLRRAARLATPEIPELPGVLRPTCVPGRDPRVEVPAETSAEPGEVVTIPALLDDALGLEAFDLEVRYDPGVLEVESDGLRPGDLVDDPEGLFVVNVLAESGTVLVSAAVPRARDSRPGSLVEIDARVRADASRGASTPINLAWVSLNEDGLVLEPEPTEQPDDEVDGVVRIAGGGPRFRRADANGDELVDISDPVFTLNFLFRGGPTPPCLAAANSNGDATADISDGVWSLNYLFRGASRPPEPFPDCGESTRAGDLALGCERGCD